MFYLVHGVQTTNQFQTAEVASAISLVLSWGLLAIIIKFVTPSLFIVIRQINDDDDDDLE